MKRALIRIGLVALVVAGMAGCGGGGGGGVPPTPEQPLPPPTTGVGPVVPTDEAVAIAATLNPEACALCHNNVSYRGGAGHQADFDQLYQNGVIKVTNVNFSTNGVDTTTLTFILQNTATATPVDCTKTSAQGFTIGGYYDPYDAATNRFVYPGPSIMSLKDNVTYDSGTGVCSFVKTFTSATDLGLIGQMTASGAGRDGIVSIYGADGILESNSAKHMNKAKFPIGAILRLGPAMGVADAPFLSRATTIGCENCHTQPYNKHAYIPGNVDDVTPGSSSTKQMFYICKTCHSDARDGGHEFWQLLKEAKDADPATAEGQALRDRAVAVDAGGALTPEEEAKYAYKTRLMNDVHMSHAMEFAYPQSMRNCVTCHKDAVIDSLNDTTGIFQPANFKAETCISCHAFNGITAKMKAANYNHAGIADTPATMAATVCTSCHGSVAGAESFIQIHTGGYDPAIYTAAGVRYSTTFVVSIDSASLDPATNILTINFTATGDLGGVLKAENITPTVAVGLYGYDTKDYIVAAHGRDSDRNRLLEFKFGDTNPRFTGTVNGPANWTVTADLSPWASMLADGSVKRAELAVMPELKDAGGAILGLDAVSRTFDLGANAFDDGFYVNPVIEHKTNRTLANGYTGVKGCNTCHDQLATTFHSGIRGGNIRVCRICHVKSSGGSHLEIQSRSIDSYVHAIHSFQIFDVGDINFADGFEAMEYRHHTETYFPRFGLGDGATDCESCHIPGAYEPSNQTKSLPALWSATDTITGTTRSITAKAAVVSGPGATACGGCHRAHKIVEDDGGGLNVLYGHWSQFGYLKDNVDTLWDAVIQHFF